MIEICSGAMHDSIDTYNNGWGWAKLIGIWRVKDEAAIIKEDRYTMQVSSLQIGIYFGAMLLQTLNGYIISYQMVPNQHGQIDEYIVWCWYKIHFQCLS